MLLRLIVTRGRKCLDYAFTVSFVHLLCCAAYDGFPLAWLWWVTQALCVVVAAVVGEWLCFKDEMLAIPISGSHVELSAETINV